MHPVNDLVLGSDLENRQIEVSLEAAVIRFRGLRKFIQYILSNEDPFLVATVNIICEMVNIYSSIAV